MFCVLDAVEARRDVDVSVQRRPEALHMFGTDRMTTKDVLRMFTEYGPRLVEWLTDSACMLVFVIFACPLFVFAVSVSFCLWFCVS